MEKSNQPDQPGPANVSHGIGCYHRNPVRRPWGYPQNQPFRLLKENRASACLHPTSLVNEIPVGDAGMNAEIAEKLKLTQKTVLPA